MIHPELQPIIEEIAEITGKDETEIKETIERLMIPEARANGQRCETWGIMVVSPHEDSPHYDIYLNVGSVWAPSRHHGPDYVPGRKA